MNYLNEYGGFLLNLAVGAATFIKENYHKIQDIEIKHDQSPVTEIDKQTEVLLREKIKKQYPTHGIIGEEFGKENPDADLVWVLDPIDGTKSFIAQVPLFGTLISLNYKGSPVLGLIQQPILQETYIGDNEQAFVISAHQQKQQLKMREDIPLDQALVLITDILDIEKSCPKTKFDSFCKKIRLLRTWGDCYGYALLAKGKAEVMLDPIMSPWDIMALLPVIKGAGGAISDWQGNPAEKGKSIIATNRNLHEEVLRLLN